MPSLTGSIASSVCCVAFFAGFSFYKKTDLPPSQSLYYLPSQSADAFEKEFVASPPSDLVDVMSTEIALNSSSLGNKSQDEPPVIDTQEHIVEDSITGRLSSENCAPGEPPSLSQKDYYVSNKSTIVVGPSELIHSSFAEESVATITDHAPIDAQVRKENKRSREETMVTNPSEHTRSSFAEDAIAESAAQEFIDAQGEESGPREEHNISREQATIAVSSESTRNSFEEKSGPEIVGHEAIRAQAEQSTSIEKHNTPREKAIVTEPPGPARTSPAEDASTKIVDHEAIDAQGEKKVPVQEQRIPRERVIATGPSEVIRASSLEEGITKSSEHEPSDAQGWDFFASLQGVQCSGLFVLALVVEFFIGRAMLSCLRTSCKCCRQRSPPTNSVVLENKRNESHIAAAKEKEETYLEESHAEPEALHGAGSSDRPDDIIGGTNVIAATVPVIEQRLQETVATCSEENNIEGSDILGGNLELASGGKQLTDIPTPCPADEESKKNKSCIAAIIEKQETYLDKSHNQPEALHGAVSSDRPDDITGGTNDIVAPFPLIEQSLLETVATCSEASSLNNIENNIEGSDIVQGNDELASVRKQFLDARTPSLAKSNGGVCESSENTSFGQSQAKESLPMTGNDSAEETALSDRSIDTAGDQSPWSIQASEHLSAGELQGACENEASPTDSTSACFEKEACYLVKGSWASGEVSDKEEKTQEEDPGEISSIATAARSAARPSNASCEESSSDSKVSVLNETYQPSLQKLNEGFSNGSVPPSANAEGGRCGHNAQGPSSPIAPSSKNDSSRVDSQKPDSSNTSVEAPKVNARIARAFQLEEERHEAPKVNARIARAFQLDEDRQACLNKRHAPRKKNAANNSSSASGK